MVTTGQPGGVRSQVEPVGRWRHGTNRTPVRIPEGLPAARIGEAAILEQIHRVFELHGFAGIETRAVEPLDRLLSKGETSKEVYLLRRLQAEKQEDEEHTARSLGLHFDLTVPFARYVLENAGHLVFPF